MSDEKILYNAVLVFLVMNSKVLLAEKGAKIGKGFLNGYGGGIEEGETPEEAAEREFAEESGGATIRSDYLDKIAVADFHNRTSQGERFICRVHVFVVRQWMGGPKSTPDMLEPNWYEVRSLPVERLMLADRYWLPQALSGYKLLVKASYGPSQQTLDGEVEIKIVANLE
ncbi:MAG: NUDIX domain-containing protein [bacterium]